MVRRERFDITFTHAEYPADEKLPFRNFSDGVSMNGISPSEYPYGFR